MPNSEDTSFRILHRRPAGPLEARWRACLAKSDFATHYTAPEYFMEPSLGGRPFAVLSVSGEEVTGVVTGVHDGSRLLCGLSVRPQICLSRSTDRRQALSSLASGLLHEAESANLIDLFAWSAESGLFDARFRHREYEGVVMLDLAQGPDALFRKFSENKRTNIKKAIKLGVSVDVARNSDDISGYYAIYVDWSRRKNLPAVGEETCQELFALTGNRRLFLARHRGRTIAGLVVRFCPGGVVEYAANSSLEQSLHLRPNDLLHWRAIEWACGEAMIKYSLGGTHLFLRKFGGEIVPTTRHRLDLSMFRRYALGDWVVDKAERALSFIPRPAITAARSLRSRLEGLRADRSRRRA